MKIAICTDIYYPMTNGVAVFSHNLALGLAKRGHQVMVMCPSFYGWPHRKNDRKTGVDTHYLTSKRFPFYPDQITEVPKHKELLGVKLPRLVYKNGIWWCPNPYQQMKKALDKFRPDVIHLQTAEGVAAAARYYAKHHGVALVSTGHAYPDNITGQFKLGLMKKPIDAALRAYMASFLKHSEYATMPTELAIHDLLPKNRRFFTVPVEALSNGVDLDQFRPGKPSAKVCRKYGLDPAQQQRVIYVGRVDPEKSISVVVEAFAQALKKLPASELVIVGDGTDRPNLERLVSELDIGRQVRFLGRVMPPELTELYQAGTVFATASETETQGIVLIEAAATGLPLVAVDAGAVRELCRTGQNGILCQPGDVSGIAQALVKILGSPDLQQKYRQGSLQVAAKHDLKHTLNRFEEIYQEAIKLKNSRAKE